MTIRLARNPLSRWDWAASTSHVASAVTHCFFSFSLRIVSSQPLISVGAAGDSVTFSDSNSMLYCDGKVFAQTWSSWMPLGSSSVSSIQLTGFLGKNVHLAEEPSRLLSMAAFSSLTPLPVPLVATLLNRPRVVFLPKLE